MKSWIRSLVSLLLLGMVLWSLDFQETLKVVQTVHPGWMLLTLATLFAGILWSAWKWMILVRCAGLTAPYSQLLRWYFIGSFLNHLLPTSIGGDAARVALLAQSVQKVSTSFFTVAAERLSGLAAMLLLAIVGTLVYPVPQDLRFIVPVYLALAAAAFLMGVWFLRSNRTSIPLNVPSGAIVDIRQQARSLLFRQPMGLTLVSVTSLVFQLQVIATAYLVGKSLQIDLSWEDCFLCVPLATLATLLPISISGIGVREFSYVALLTRSGLATEEAFLIGFGTYLFVLIVSAAGGLIVIFTAGKNGPRHWTRRFHASVTGRKD